MKLNKNTQFKFILRLNEGSWGSMRKGDTTEATINLLDDYNGLARFPIDKRWDIMHCELVIDEESMYGDEEVSCVEEKPCCNDEQVDELVEEKLCDEDIYDNILGREEIEKQEEDILDIFKQNFFIRQILS